MAPGLLPVAAPMAPNKSLLAQLSKRGLAANFVRWVTTANTEIRAQLKATTSDTEEIKQHLASHAWRSQQTWSARERYYSQLLTHLHHFKMALGDLSDYYLEPGTEHMPDDTRGEHFRDLQTDAATAYTGAQKLLGPAAVFLTPGAVVALEELFKEHWGLANFGAVCTADYVAGAHKLAIAAYEQVLNESKCHLGITSDA